MGYEYQDYKQYIVYCDGDGCSNLLNNGEPMSWIDIETNLEFENWVRKEEGHLCHTCQKMTKE